jgi:type III pantothenate kinase
MNLIIDQGNTLFKVALFRENELISKSKFTYLDVNLFYDWLAKKNEKKINIIVSSVVNQRIDLSKIPSNKVICLDQRTDIPLVNGYFTPETLGYDRIANAVAVNSLNPNQNSLVIDLGTCIKYDLVNSRGIYLGGNISLGLNMRYKALNHFTDQLPLLNPSEFQNTHGVDTESSIKCGVQLAIEHEISGFIERYSQEFKPLTIFMTGGDLKYFDKSFKNHIFANSDLTLIGLNEILRHNA